MPNGLLDVLCTPHIHAIVVPSQRMVERLQSPGTSSGMAVTGSAAKTLTRLVPPTLGDGEKTSEVRRIYSDQGRACAPCRPAALPPLMHGTMSLPSSNQLKKSVQSNLGRRSPSELALACHLAVPHYHMRHRIIIFTPMALLLTSQVSAFRMGISGTTTPRIFRGHHWPEP